MQLSTGARPESRQGPCAIDLRAVEQVIVAGLRRAGIRASPWRETMELERRHMQEDQRAREEATRDPRSTDRLAEERRRRLAIEAELNSRPMLATGLNSMPTVSADGISGCAVAVTMRVTGSTPSRRPTLSATGREIVAPIFLWSSPLNLSFVPAAEWQPSAAGQVSEALDDFLQLWRDHNRVGSRPAEEPARPGMSGTTR